jgi:predicted GNAT family acetyltransferase
VTTVEPDESSPGTEVRDNPERQRYELRRDGVLAGFATYHRQPGHTVVLHVEIEPQWERQGLGSALVKGALDDIVARGETITPQCPFAAAYVRRHPSYLAHVADASS